MASLSVEGLLSALGWKYAQGSDKAIPFADSFDLLGVRLEVDALSLGRVSLENKPGRVSKLLETAAAIKRFVDLSTSVLRFGKFAQKCFCFAAAILRAFFLHALLACMLLHGC